MYKGKYTSQRQAEGSHEHHLLAGAERRGAAASATARGQRRALAHLFLDLEGRRALDAFLPLLRHHLGIVLEPPDRRRFRYTVLLAQIAERILAALVRLADLEDALPGVPAAVLPAFRRVLASSTSCPSHDHGVSQLIARERREGAGAPRFRVLLLVAGSCAARVAAAAASAAAATSEAWPCSCGAWDWAAAAAATAAAAAAATAATETAALSPLPLPARATGTPSL
jgi:hypothetical protein